MIGKEELGAAGPGPTDTKQAPELESESLVRASSFCKSYNRYH